jgi:XTP/dITP diphosphohydrolase
VRLFFGTGNPGKLRELRRLVAGLPVEVVTPADLPGPLPEVPEEGATFEANAEHKAREYARLTGMLALADDSGLCVDALGGAPGVHSARWSDRVMGPAPARAEGPPAPGAAARVPGDRAQAARDERNNELLLASLAGLGPVRRGAEYRAVLALARPDGTLVGTVRGVCRGRIAEASRGEGGFGYDPLFVPDAGASGLAAGRTMAELTAEEKDAVSHRGAAFRALRPLLDGCLLDGGTAKS